MALAASIAQEAGPALTTAQQAWREVQEKFNAENVAILRSLGFTGTDAEGLAPAPSYPQYRHPRKRFRLKQKAVPQWYKARTGTRTRVQSGAARVARYRPKTRPF